MHILSLKPSNEIFGSIKAALSPKVTSFSQPEGHELVWLAWIEVLFIFNFITKIRHFGFALRNAGGFNPLNDLTST